MNLYTQDGLSRHAYVKNMFHSEHRLALWSFLACDMFLGGWRGLVWVNCQDSLWQNLILM